MLCSPVYYVWFSLVLIPCGPLLPPTSTVLVAARMVYLKDRSGHLTRMLKTSSGFYHIEHNPKPPAWPSEAFVVWPQLPLRLHLLPLCPSLENSNHPGLLVVHQEGQAGSHLRASALAFSFPGPFFFLMARSPLDSLPHTIQVSAQMALCQLDTAHPLFFVLRRTQVLCPPHSLSPHHASFSLRVLITAK